MRLAPRACLPGHKEDRSSEAAAAAVGSSERPPLEDRLWSYFERETGGRARCALCGTSLPTHADALAAHLKHHHSKLAKDLAQESDVEPEAEDSELISEIVFLQDGNDGSEKKYATLIEREDQREDAYKRRKRHHDADATQEKYRLPKMRRTSVSSDDDRPVLLVASGKKDNEEADAFSRYLMQLLKSLPKHIQTKLQMEIVNVVMKAKLEYEAKLQEKEEEEKNAASAAKDSHYSVLVTSNEPSRRIVCRKSEIDSKNDMLGDIVENEIRIVTEDGSVTTEVNLPTIYTDMHSM